MVMRRRMVMMTVIMYATILLFSGNFLGMGSKKLSS